MSEFETPEVVDLPKPSKLNRFKSAAFTAGIFLIPTVMTVGSVAYSYKIGKMQFDTAKLNLEAAKINFPQS